MEGIAAYQENSVTTQSRGRIIVMLYEGCIKFLKQARQASHDADYQRKAYFLNKGVAILEELNFALDLEKGGEVARNLRNLYLFMVRHLNQACISNEPHKIDEVISLLDELNSGWKTVTE